MFTAMSLYVNGDLKERLQLSFELFDDDGNGQLDRVSDVRVRYLTASGADVDTEPLLGPWLTK